MKKGDKVTITDYKDIPSDVVKMLKKKKWWVIRRIKPSGGILLEGIEIGWQHELAGGNEQGLMPRRLKKVNLKK